MTRESKRIVAEGIAEELKVDELVEEREKTQSSEIRKTITEEIAKRTVCPECQNDLMKNEKDNNMYCPGCGYGHSL